MTDSDLDGVQKQMDAEDQRIRAAILLVLYQEKMAMTKTVSDAKKRVIDDKRLIKETEARLTEKEWFIQEQLRIIVGKQKPGPEPIADNSGRGVPTP